MSENPEAVKLRKTLAIARAQKGVLFCVLANLLWPLFPPLFFVILPFQVYFVYRLVKLVDIGFPPVWVVGMFIPFLNLLLLVLVAQQSSMAIREAGFGVRLMGAELKVIEEALNRSEQERASPE